MTLVIVQNEAFSRSSILLYSLLFHSISTCSYSGSTLFNCLTRAFFSSSLLFSSFLLLFKSRFYFFFYSFISVYVVTIDIRYFICRSSLFIDKRVREKKEREYDKTCMLGRILSSR